VIAAVLLCAASPSPPGDVVPAFERAQAGIPPLAIGVHAPNRAWTDDDFARVAPGQFGAVKMMSYHPLPDYARLRHDNPRLSFVVRLNTPWNELPPPEEFAAANMPYLRQLLDAGYDPWVEIGNEPNLELHPEAETAFGAWYLAVLRSLRAAVPQAKYGFPGLAQDQREAAWLDANAAVVEASDWLGVHAYWTNEREMLDPRHALKFVAVHRRFPHLALVVTEAGNTGYGISSAQRGAEYDRFLRTVDRLPYVRAVYFFILSGTSDWQRFFFDAPMLAAMRDVGHDPNPIAEGVAACFSWTQRAIDAAIASFWGRSVSDREHPDATPAATPPPAPTPVPFARRQLLAAADPFAEADVPCRGDVCTARPLSACESGGTPGRWLPLSPAAAPAAALRTASTSFATDVSVRATLLAPASVPLAVQFADQDAFAPGQHATGFALLWSGERWRLQYRHDGDLAADVPLPVLPDGGPEAWYQVEIALERRSAAAWVWPRGAPQPAQPGAVFAPPEAAAGDGARPRVLFLPDHPLENVVLEGATRV
jgi:hypothetical protein